jgi:hypothetical protein
MQGPVQPLCTQPESGGPLSTQQAALYPQLSEHDPVQPPGVQHVLLLEQIAPPEQLHDCGTPQLSAIVVLHELPH